MKFSSHTKFASITTERAYELLRKGTPEEQDLYQNIGTAIGAIKEDAFCGIQIPKKLIPKEYRRKHHIRNLWKFNLPKGWRLLYSIESDGVIIISIILEWFDHKNYERKMNY